MKKPTRSYLSLWIESSWGVSGLRENDPELLTEAKEARLGSSCQFLKGTAAAPQPLTQSECPERARWASPAGTGITRREARLCLEVRLGQAAEKSTALSVPSFPAQCLLLEALPGLQGQLGIWSRSLELESRVLLGDSMHPCSFPWALFPLWDNKSSISGQSAGREAGSTDSSGEGSVDKSSNWCFYFRHTHTNTSSKMPGSPLHTELHWVCPEWLETPEFRREYFYN